MHTAHAHAPVSPASRRFPLNHDLADGSDQDLADKFISLLQNLVSRPDSPEAEIEVRAAEFKVKPKQQESAQTKGSHSRAGTVPEPEREANPEAGLEARERASESSTKMPATESTPVEDLAVVAVAPFVPVTGQKLEARPVEKNSEVVLPVSRQLVSRQPVTEVQLQSVQPESLPDITHGKAYVLEQPGNSDNQQVLGTQQKISVKTEQKGEYRAEVQLRPEPEVVVKPQPVVEYPPLKRELRVEKLPENLTDGEESVLLPQSPDLSELRTPERSINTVAADVEKKPVIKDSAVRGALPYLLRELASNTASGRGVSMPERLPERAEQVFGVSLSNEKSRGLVPNGNSRSQALSARQEAIINQINKLLDRAAQAKDGSSFTVKIQPEELGEVLVKVTQRGDQLFVRIVPEHKEVEQILRIGINELLSQLINSGFRAENIHVSVGRESSETALFSEKFSNFSNLLGNNGDQSARGEQKGGGHGSRLSEGTVRGEPKTADSGWVA